MSLIKMKVFC
uniref:Uncharacterized protein n=1 Tax=Anguilla anguilla TaxID=7936 RepID=A0A0E9SZC9_ANGAN